MHSSIELLESRIAPAGVSVSYVDSDEDKVKITVSHGPLDAADLTLSAGATGDLVSLNLTDVAFAGANLTFAVTKAAHGDGRANVGTIDSTGNDLGKILVKGDLSRVLAGNNDTTTPALNRLQARSLGVEKIGPSTETSLVGGIMTVNIARDIQGARIYTHGPNILIPDDSARIDVLHIGGSLIGEAAVDSGSVQAEGGFRAISIGGSIIGAVGGFSGRLEGNDGITSLRVGGSIVGGAGQYSGMVSADVELGKVFIGRDLAGAGGPGSGSLRINGSIGNVHIGRDLLGGTGTESGLVWAKNGQLGRVSVGRNVHGGDTVAANIEKTGTIFAHDSIVRVSIGGSLISGSDLGPGTLKTSGAIVAGKHLGPVSIRGNIVGNASMPVLISGVAMESAPLTGMDFAIDRLTVGHSVSYADIKAGFNTNGAADNADASIGRVRVGGGWSFSNLVAGVQDTGAVGFGLGDSLQAVDDNPLTFARIAGITIAGKITSGGSAIYGFVSQQIDFLSIAGKRVAQTSGPSNDGSKLVGATTNVYLEEVV